MGTAYDPEVRVDLRRMNSAVNSLRELILVDTVTIVDDETILQIKNLGAVLEKRLDYFREKIKGMDPRPLVHSGRPVGC